MAYSDQNKLIDSIIADIYDNKKIIFLFGSGISLNTGNESNGIGGKSYFIEKFKSKLQNKYSTSAGREQLSVIIAECEESDNPYSAFAKQLILSDENISKLFIEEICPILNNSDLNANKPVEYLAERLRQKEVCEKVYLNQGLESFGKFSFFLPKSTKIITSNIDPFVEIVLTKNNTDFISISYSYNLTNRKIFEPSKPEIVIEHYNGYWLKESLHNNLENNQSNTEDFEELIEKTDSLYVFGFGGWKDTMMIAINKYLNATRKKNCKIHWSFLKDKDAISRKSNPLLKPIFESQKCESYYNIDTNKFFPNLLKTCYERYLREFLKEYKLNELNNIDYSKNRSVFHSVDFKYGTLDDRKTIGKDLDIVEFIIENYRKGKNIVICSKFGLGKTTVLENCFIAMSKTGNVYPVIINLAYHELSTLVKSEQSFSTVILEKLNLNKDYLDQEKIKFLLDDYLMKGEVVLLLDAIDESIFKESELKAFRTKLLNLKYPVITSIRLEFHEFIDKSFEFQDWDYIAIELLEWDANLLELFFNESNIEDSISRKIRLNYENLNKRPLFIRLLISLLEDSEDYHVEDNIASLYFNTLDRTINYQLDKIFIKETDKNLKLLKKEYFDLLNRISIAIYLEFQHYKHEENYDTIPRVTFSEENIRLIVSQNKILDFEKLKYILTNESQSLPFHIIKSLNINSKNLYTFFHRSLFEYLVAHGAANKIFREKKCSSAWDVYQTDEVSEYFVHEVERLSGIYDKDVFSNSLFTAFFDEFSDLEELEQFAAVKVKVDAFKSLDSTKPSAEKLEYRTPALLKNNDHLLNYSERLEEVIYYVGKFKKYFSPEHLTEFNVYCKFIYYNRNNFDTTFHRSCAITLSRLNSNVFMYDYLSRVILDSASSKQHLYNTQILKDTKYYGKEQLQEKCIIAYQSVIQKTSELEIKPLELLKMFSLFVSLDITSLKDFSEKINLFNNLWNHACKFEMHELKGLLEGLKYLMDVNSLSDRLSIVSLQENLIAAFKKRKENFPDSEIIRLVNSTGDGLEGLAIDYYNGHFIIESNIDYFIDSKEKIKASILDFYAATVKSISFKHHEKSLTNPLTSDKDIELLFGALPELIECFEIINCLVDPGMSKTGFFIDNRNIRRYLHEIAKGKSVLNLCSFTCSLGAIARLAGATKVVNVEKKADCMELGKKIYKLNGLKVDEGEFVNETIQDYFQHETNTYDIIILDLPGFGNIPCNFENISSFYADYNSLALRLLNKGGELITSCCSRGFSRARFIDLLENLVKGTDYKITADNNILDRLIDHPFDEEVTHSDYLKIYRIR